MALQAPPINEPVIDTEAGNVARVPWILFFNQVYGGDQGNTWNPDTIIFNGLSVSGSATYSGRFYKISSKLIYFAVQITTTGNTTSTAGTTYIDMATAPFTLVGDGACLAVSGGTGTNAGHCIAGSNRIYVPGWSAISNPITIVGIVEAS